MRIWREWKMKIHKLKLNAKYYEDSERCGNALEIAEMEEAGIWEE